MFRIVDCYLADYIEDEMKKVLPERVEQLLSMIPNIFIFAFTWSIAATTDLPGREKFNTFIRNKMKKLHLEFPEENMVYDYMYDVKECKWVGWLETI